MIVQSLPQTRVVAGGKKAGFVKVEVAMRVERIVRLLQQWREMQNDKKLLLHLHGGAKTSEGKKEELEPLQGSWPASNRNT